MAIAQAPFNLDDYFTRVPSKVILNDLKQNVNDLKNIKDLIYTSYEKEISMIPKCECGKLKGAYLLGRTCPHCNLPVVKMFSNIHPILWVRKFKDDYRFINPKFWADLSRIITTKIDALRWLSDPTYNPSMVPSILHNLKEIIGGRSYPNVLNNLEKIIIYLKRSSKYRVFTKANKLNYLHDTYKEYKDILFSDHMAIINKKLFVVENTNKGNYTIPLLADVIDIALLAVATANDPTLDDKKASIVTAKLISKTASLFTGYIKEIVSRKGGLARKNVYGTRAHFTFRCVASAISINEDYDSTHVPWMIGPVVFRPHILNKLIKRGYTPAKASELIFQSIMRYHPLIDEILKELIAEAPNKGIPMILGRNPSLLQGSLQHVYITKFKTNLNDNTISVSTMIAKALNLDYDGDELNLMPLLDNHMEKMAAVFKPHVNIVALDNFRISGNLNIPSTSMITLMNYINKDDGEDTECPIAKELEGNKNL